MITSNKVLDVLNCHEFKVIPFFSFCFPVTKAGSSTKTLSGLVVVVSFYGLISDF